jgi:DNA-binding CsgD family transcriptional regulator
MISLQKNHLLDISSLINNAPDNSSLRELRLNVLKLILPIFQADGASFFLTDSERRYLDIPDGVIHELDSNVTPYQQYYQKYDPFREVIYSTNLTCATDKMFADKWWENSMYYNDFLRPKQLSHEMIICIRSENRLYGKIGIFRQIGRPCFDDHDRAIALVLAKHLKYVIENINLSRVCEDKINIYREFDDYPLMGIIVLDFNIKPVYYNEMAKKICWAIKKEGDIEGNSCGQRSISIPYQVIRNCQDLKSYFKLGETGAPFCVSNIYMNQGREYKFRSFLNARTSCSKELPSFIVLIEDCAELRQIKERTAMFKYKLSKRELEICSLVRDGLTNKEISTELFLSLCTVETHLRNIFDKTKANNRAELIKLLDCCY